MIFLRNTDVFFFFYFQYHLKPNWTVYIHITYIIYNPMYTDRMHDFYVFTKLLDEYVHEYMVL